MGLGGATTAQSWANGNGTLIELGFKKLRTDECTVMVA